MGKEVRPDLVAHPWRTVVQEASGETARLPAGARLLDVFDQHGRTLLILGAAGAGKTTTLLELARDAIAQARDDPLQPVPVVFTLASWGYRWQEQDLAAWLVEELKTKYRVPERVGQQWLADDALLLLLDGLDEVASARRGACVEAINRFGAAHGLAGLVVCSRTREYEALGRGLALGAAVLLQPLSAEQVDTHLAQLGPAVEHVRAAVQQDAALRELAKTPLFLSVMLLAYLDAPVSSGPAGATAAEQRRHLFATYVQRMFTRRTAAQRYRREDTLRRLAWLAWALLRHGETLFDPSLLGRRAPGSTPGLAPDWLPSHRARRWYAITLAPARWLSAGLLFGLGLTLPQHVYNGLGGLTHRPMVALLEALPDGLPIWLYVAVATGLFVPFVALPAALAFGVPALLAVGCVALVPHAFLRIFLWRHGLAPLKYVRFLDYCVERIFLQRVGGGYIFVHRLLMEYFASLYQEREDKAADTK